MGRDEPGKEPVHANGGMTNPSSPREASIVGDDWRASAAGKEPKKPLGTERRGRHAG